MSTPRRYRAPTANGDILADPPIGTWPDLVEENRRLFDGVPGEFGTYLRHLRRSARQDTTSDRRPLHGPLVLTGHQPELFHPGVWVKNFALNGLARTVGGTALNLIVDTDTMKSASLRFPVLGPASEVRTEAVPFDTFDAEQAYEGRTVRDPELFRSFAERAEVVTKAWSHEPLLAALWPRIAGLASGGRNLCERFTLARQFLERGWGCENRESTVSSLSRTAAFGQFARHLAADADRFRSVYNAALAAYRRANGIDSRNHPAPDLAPGETPFWAVRPGEPRRKATAATPPDELRPRALTLTLFARLILGDFFVHGIGGGKYDEVTDQIIRDYFGTEPPRYAVLSATLHLPLPTFDHTGDDVRRMERGARDLLWNPQRHATDGIELDRLRREKADLIAGEPTGPDDRRHWYHDLRAVTERLRPFVAKELGERGRELDLARVEARANEVLTRRDYSWVLYPEEVLRPFLQRFL